MRAEKQTGFKKHLHGRSMWGEGGADLAIFESTLYLLLGADLPCNLKAEMGA
jgi:hypothetical protein